MVGIVGVCARGAPMLPSVNVCEGELAAHTLVLARRLHGAGFITLDDRLVASGATVVAFVHWCHGHIVSFPDQDR